MRSLVTLSALAGFTSLAAASSLKLASSYSGDTFFNGFYVNGSETDPTNYGNIHYVNSSVATSDQLAYVNSAGNVILKVDNSSSDPNPGEYSTFGRNTVMVISNDTIVIGTLVAIDATHIPYGCSVWPSFWTLDTETGTDENGEIDIIETVNLKSANQYSLHAKSGCTLVNDTSFPHTGTDLYTNCDYNYTLTGNEGCGISETASSSSVGSAFASNGGGVYAMYWSTDGIQIWFFERSNIPSDLTSESPDPSSWDEPSASYPTSGCDPSTYFKSQSLIINTDICGAWAGSDSVFTSTGCSGSCADLVGTASNYDTAYWEIQYVKTFTSSGSSSASATGTSTKTSTSSSSSSTSSSGTAQVTASVLGLLAAMIVCAVMA
ncbi:hypothetical protein PUNSTDRAFT_126043 [Punctularia strigosozonata HHB-11173 SS5]|uniref:uncharacterized protein n=1 Tax=Punctularia strigosozonata (strain HHB-11173) TaxID=741275 RepID=UPI00044166A9|nr:uncharacterized protein PUNSTDRAFT_126043 [Punctularia strigosozonata HHB-11173 SS5]EIN08747.1 hypothetical protein PUNSTDRAFT_126043 [Punctularia strigosozonata HHB-11173 SS5]